MKNRSKCPLIGYQNWSNQKECIIWKVRHIVMTLFLRLRKNAISTLFSWGQSYNTFQPPKNGSWPRGPLLWRCRVIARSRRHRSRWWRGPSVSSSVSWWFQYVPRPWRPGRSSLIWRYTPRRHPPASWRTRSLADHSFLLRIRTHPLFTNICIYHPYFVIQIRFSFSNKMCKIFI